MLEDFPCPTRMDPAAESHHLDQVTGGVGTGVELESKVG